jgi:cytochrome c oxidase subunit 2
MIASISLSAWKRIAAAASAALTAAAVLLLARAAHAQEAQQVPGHAAPEQIWLMPPATPLAEHIERFHFALLYVVFGVAALVLALLVYTVIRYWSGWHKTPSRNAHNTTLEVLWTAIPLFIVLGIAVGSFALLDDTETPQDAALTVKVVGHQWYWTYEYPDFGDEEHGVVSFASTMKQEATPGELGELRLLEVNDGERLVLPTDTNIRFLVTSAPNDVIHSWAVPSFGVKIDAVPARINETWTRIEYPGVYYGQCSELCGENHAYMPIAVEAVSPAEFDQWIAGQQRALGLAEDSITTLTALEARAASGEATWADVPATPADLSEPVIERAPEQTPAGSEAPRIEDAPATADVPEQIEE